MIARSSLVALSWMPLNLSLRISAYRSGVISLAVLSTSLNAATRFLVRHLSCRSTVCTSLTTSRRISTFVCVQS